MQGISCTLTVTGGNVIIGILEPNRDITIKRLALNVASRAQCQSRGLSSIDISSISCCRGSWSSQGDRGQRGNDSRGRETHCEGLKECLSTRLKRKQERESQLGSSGL